MNFKTIMVEWASRKFGDVHNTEFVISFVKELFVCYVKNEKV